MRFKDEIVLKTITKTPDGFGGNILTQAAGDTIFATVSVKNDDLKAKPSGLGYYRTITVMAEKDALEVGQQIGYDGATYNLVRLVPQSQSVYETFVGYEV